eukprot:7195091-Pyramimonas_sp.AAC.2
MLSAALRQDLDQQSLNVYVAEAILGDLLKDLEIALAADSSRGTLGSIKSWKEWVRSQGSSVSWMHKWAKWTEVWKPGEVQQRSGQWSGQPASVLRAEADGLELLWKRGCIPFCPVAS